MIKKTFISSFPNAQAEFRERGFKCGRPNGVIPPEMAEIEGCACRKVNMTIHAAHLGLSQEIYQTPELRRVPVQKQMLRYHRGRSFSLKRDSVKRILLF